LLVKVIDRVLYKLDDLVRPYVHKILVVIEPLLIDEDYYARVEGVYDNAYVCMYMFVDMCIYICMFLCIYIYRYARMCLSRHVFDSGREIISNLAKAAGLATMIATMRPDIDNEDEYVRNTTARAFAVVASALGIHSLVPFLKVCALCVCLFICTRTMEKERMHTHSSA